MDGLTVTAFAFALTALSLAVYLFIRIENIEKKLKDFDVIPKDFSSEG